MVTADNEAVGNLQLFKIIWAKDVFPEPGGPQKIIDWILLKLILNLPTKSSIVFGRNNSANGLSNKSQSSGKIRAIEALN